MSQDPDPSVAYAHSTFQLDSEDAEIANVLIQEAMRGDRFECRKPPLLMRGDCLELMGLLPDNSVDLIISDPPSGCTDGDGDAHLNLNKMWAQYNRVLKPKGTVVLFACAIRGNHRESSFLAKLITSNAEDFRYHMVWHKNTMTNPTNVGQRVLPLRDHEDILVFYRQPGTYNPQMTKKTGNKNGIGEKEKYSRSVIEGFKPIPRPFHPEERNQYLCWNTWSRCIRISQTWYLIIRWEVEVLVWLLSRIVVDLSGSKWIHCTIHTLRLVYPWFNLAYR